MSSISPMTDTTRSNRERFSILVAAFALSLEDIARVVGLSRPLLSRALHGHVGINHEAVYARLERHLPDIIAKRGKAFFEVDAIPAEKIEELKKAS